MVALQNEVIRSGAFSAYQQAVTEHWFSSTFLTGPGAISCHLAEKAQIVALQTLERHPALPPDWADIGTFVAPRTRRGGAGRALFSASLAAARQAGISTLNASIRGDNTAALAFYSALGFVDYALDPGWCLADGRVTGRVSKRFNLH